MIVVSRRFISPRKPKPARPVMLPSPIEDAMNAASCLLTPAAMAASGRNRNGTRNGSIIIAQDDAKTTYPLFMKENIDFGPASRDFSSLSSIMSVLSEDKQQYKRN